MNYRTRLEAKLENTERIGLSRVKTIDDLMTQTIALAEALEKSEQKSDCICNYEGGCTTCKAQKALSQFNQWLGE